MRCADLVAGLAAVLAAFAVGCGRNDPPRLKATLLPPGGAAERAAGDLRVQLRNIGGRTLAFDGVAPICGCAPTAALPATLAPGTSTHLDLRCAPGTTGVREIRVRSNDPNAAETVLAATLPAAGGVPAAAPLYFGYVAVGDSATLDVVLPSPLDRVPPPDDAGLTVEALTGRPDAAAGVRVRFTPRRAGVVRATLDLGASGGKVGVVGVGYDGVLAFPAEIGAAGGSLPAINLIAAGGAQLAVARVEYPPGLAGELRAVSPGRQLRLVLRGRAAVPADASAAIRLIDADGATLLTIPVLAPGPRPGTPPA